MIKFIDFSFFPLYTHSYKIFSIFNLTSYLMLHDCTNIQGQKEVKIHTTVKTSRVENY